MLQLPPALEQAMTASKTCSLLDTHPRAMALETKASGSLGPGDDWGAYILMQPWPPQTCWGPTLRAGS